MYLDIVDRGTPRGGRRSTRSDPLAGRAHADARARSTTCSTSSGATSATRLRTLLGTTSATGCDDRGATLQDRVRGADADRSRSAGGITDAARRPAPADQRLVHNTAVADARARPPRRPAARRSCYDRQRRPLNDAAGGSGDLDATLRALPPTLAAIDSSFAAVDGVIPATSTARSVRSTRSPSELPASLSALRAPQRHGAARRAQLALAGAPARAVRADARAAVGEPRHDRAARCGRRPTRSTTSTKAVAGCEKGIQGFFQWNASISKFGDVARARPARQRRDRRAVDRRAHPRRVRAAGVHARSVRSAAACRRDRERGTDRMNAPRKGFGRDLLVVLASVADRRRVPRVLPRRSAARCPPSAAPTDVKAVLPTSGALTSGARVTMAGAEVGKRQVRQAPGRRRSRRGRDPRRVGHAAPERLAAHDAPAHAGRRELRAIVRGKAKTMLARGDTIPISAQTDDYVDVDQVLSVLSGDSSEHARKLIQGGGAALDGRGRDLNDLLRGTSDAFVSGSALTASLHRDRRQISRLVAQLGDVTSALGERDESIRVLARSGSSDLPRGRRARRRPARDARRAARRRVTQVRRTTRTLDTATRNRRARALRPCGRRARPAAGGAQPAPGGGRGAARGRRAGARGRTAHHDGA